MSPYCRYCLDRGCLICDKYRAARIAARALEEEAAEFLRQEKIPGPWTTDLIELVVRAIQYGAERHQRMERAQTQSTGNPPRERWDLLEIPEEACPS